MPNLDAHLQIFFPKSSEDHRLQLIAINGSIFAIVHTALESDGPIRLHCEDWSLILLAPIKSKKEIVISAINVVCLNEVSSEEGPLNIEATNRLVKLTPSLKSPEKVRERGDKGVYPFEEDPGALLLYFRLFNSVLSSIHSSLHSEAQKQFITILCALADKMVGNNSNLNIHEVLGIWDIPVLKS